MKTVNLTPEELEFVLRGLDLLLNDLLAAVDPDVDAVIDLHGDLFEIQNRDDGWDEDRAQCPVCQPAGLEMIQAGIDAREQAKASSMAADRRAERMMQGTASPVDTEWNPNDPANW